LIAHTEQLGGKSPVIVSSCANVKIAAIRMLSMKSPCSGQTCGGSLVLIRVNPGSTLMRTVAPDYILCARDRVDDLIREFRSAWVAREQQAVREVKVDSWSTPQCFDEMAAFAVVPVFPA
jgi:hypothetical protein